MSNKFDLTQYKGKYVMHCATKRQAEVFCDFLDKHGLTWCSGIKYIPDTNYCAYQAETCYDFNDGTYCRKQRYLELGYCVLEFTSFDWKEYGYRLKPVPVFTYDQFMCSSVQEVR